MQHNKPKTIIAQPKVVCAYIDDPRDVMEGEAYDKFTPILYAPEIISDTTVAFNHKDNVLKNITTHNQNATTRRLEQSVKDTTKIDTSQYDIFPEAAEIILNCTTLDLTVFNKYGIPTIFPPTKNTYLAEKYRNNVIMITIHKLNLPSIVSKLQYSDASYLDVYETFLKGVTTPNYNEFKVVIKAAIDYWITVLNDKSKNMSFKSNSIKVVTVTEVHVDNFDSGLINEDVSVMVMPKSIIISTSTIYKPIDISILLGNIDILNINSEIVEGARNVYIIDNEDSIGNRYINILDTPKMLSKFHALSKPSGLYVVKMVKTNSGINGYKAELELYIPLSELDSIKYIYKSIEEATHGANKAQLYTDEVVVKKAELEHAKIDNEIVISALTDKKVKAEHKKNKVKGKIDIEVDRVNAETNRIKAEYEASKLKYEQWALNNRYYYEDRSYRSKSRYEEDKYERDSSLETLKVAGAICSVLAGGYLLYKQLNKS